jgi:uncharacterized protein involved in type VI secretion and phage assembly
MDGFVETLSRNDKDHEPFGIAAGIVTNNLDLLGEGRVQVRIPAMPGFEPWARIASVGGGSGRGFVWMPAIDDEVLVAFAQNDPAAAYVLGGLWNTKDRPPLSLPTDFLTKRVIRTGVSDAPLAHEIVFDDLTQTVTVTTSTKQTVTLSPDKIELSGAAGALTITMDTKTQTISMVAPVKIELQAAQISLKGATIDIESTATVSIQSEGECSISGSLIRLN